MSLDKSHAMTTKSIATTYFPVTMQQEKGPKRNSPSFYVLPLQPIKGRAQRVTYTTTLAQASRFWSGSVEGYFSLWTKL